MKLNKVQKIYTHEGAVASHVNSIEALRRSVMACLLWEKTFYEDGESIATRIKNLVAATDPDEVMKLAIEARTSMKLRHVPLLLMRELARHPKKPRIADALAEVIQRADEITEFMAIYQKDGKQPISAQVKKGLAKAFNKFNEYQFAKYNRDGAYKFKDVAFLVHPKAKDQEQGILFSNLFNKTNYPWQTKSAKFPVIQDYGLEYAGFSGLKTPDTWEVALSGGADKRVTFERLLQENKLGYMALLRNLRNIQQAGVDESLIISKLLAGAKKSKVLPFRFIAAARAVPMWERYLDTAMQMSCEDLPKLLGKTAILVDVSGSMDHQLSCKSDLTRIDAASALAVLLSEISEKLRVFTFSNLLVEVPARRGMALIDAINKSQIHGGTYLGKAINDLKGHIADYDRLIVITDEQSHDPVGKPVGKGYMINVATNQNGVGYGDWLHISGFSESIVTYISELEKNNI